jgi:hypothetical protein
MGMAGMVVAVLLIVIRIHRVELNVKEKKLVNGVTAVEELVSVGRILYAMGIVKYVSIDMLMFLK